ncbi:hypothetical protein [Streptomyces sp. SID5910]|uniref:hypothetical protein n=1 Tax=Streptomyces sp. SID5910 TaxID=2690312 RepID=UPI00136DAB58|nr:hypothetical protein [Streptomyces sp. SID5910]MYR45095.1 hypothetical protein [Streptomyces sp. SID5910]
MSADTETRDDRSGSASHVLLLSVAFAVPVLKLGWTLGSGAAAREALTAMGPANWFDILIGMFLDEPVLATVTAVVVSRTSYAYFAARGGALRLRDMPVTTSALVTVLVPVAMGLVVAVFNGVGWGLATGCLSYVLRLGVVAEYRSGRRRSGTGRRTGRQAVGPLERAADAAWILSLVLAFLVLPFVALTVALDGRAWSSVAVCDVDTGDGTERHRLVELSRDGTGVVGWDVAQAEVANGVHCAADENEVVRDPWWSAG